MSRPLDNGAYRNALSPEGDGEEITPTSDFSGLVISHCGLARAAAKAPIESLDRCMGAFRLHEFEADRAGFRSFCSDTVTGRLSGVLRHEPFQLRLGSLVLDESLSGPAVACSEFLPGI